MGKMSNPGHGRPAARTMASSPPTAGRRLAALGRHLIRRWHLQQAAATPITRVITLEELARHRSASSCWVALSGDVYDFTEFVQSGQHPGGARSLLHHAGTDASEAFAELHTQSIFAAFAPRCRIGVLETTRRTPASPPSADEPTTTQSSTAPRTLWPGVRPSSRGWAGLPSSLGDVSPLLTCLPSPFPHDRFTATGCESFRFHWTIADRLLRLGDDDAHDRRDQQAAQPVSQQRQQMHMHRQKSNLGVLNAERDWLHVGAPEVYAAEMVLKERLYLEHSEKVYVTTTGDDGDDGATLAAEVEVLEEVLQWLARRYPKRFQLRYVPASASEVQPTVEAVTTLTPGYRRCYALAEWTTRPLVLVGMLVQEDFYLLDERAATAGEVRQALQSLGRAAVRMSH
jgi:cytochrome b involved in lipid metabolism